MIHFIKCPLSGSVHIKEALQARDHTVSGKVFGIWETPEYDYRFTNPVPEKFDMQKYYESDNYVSHTATKKGLINRLYHLAQRYTMTYKRGVVNKTTGLATGSLLDYGCGIGTFASVMQQAGWQVKGYEPGDKAAAYAIDKNKIEIIGPSALENPSGAGYDAITLWHVLEHIPDPHTCLEQLAVMLKNKGVMLVALPNFRSLDARYYGSYWAGYDVPRHLHHFSFESFRYLAGKSGLEVEQILPMHLDGFYVSMLSEKYLGRKGSQIRGIVTGFRSWLNGRLRPRQGSSLLYVCRKKG